MDDEELRAMFAREHPAAKPPAAAGASFTPGADPWGGEWWALALEEERVRRLANGETLPTTLPAQRRRRMNPPETVSRGMGIPPYRE